MNLAIMAAFVAGAGCGAFIGGIAAFHLTGKQIKNIVIAIFDEAARRDVRA